MADPITSAPSVIDLERVIQIEAAKESPNFNVIRETTDLLRRVIEQKGGPLRQLTTQELYSAEISKEPPWKQALLGASTTPARMVQGIGGLLPEPFKPSSQSVEETKMIRGATPMTSLGSVGGDVLAFGVLPARGANMASGGRWMTSRPAQVADVAATGATVQAATSPEDRAQAGAWGALGGVAPALTGIFQRAMPQVVGGVSKPQVHGESLLRDFGSEADDVIRALKSSYAPVPGVSGSSAVVTKNPLLQTLETGSRTGHGERWLPFDESNAQARFDSLMKAAGTQQERNALTAERERVTSALRSGAFDSTRGGTLSMAPTLGRLDKILGDLKAGEQRPNPAVQKVVAYVEKELANPQGFSPQQLYTVRKVLTGQIKTGPNEEIGVAASAARRETVSIVKEIDEMLDGLSGGDWSAYLAKYGDMSKEVASKTVLQNAIDDMTINLARGRVPPALEGKSGETTLSRVVNKHALDEFGAKTVDQLTPDHRALIEALKDDLSRTAAAMNSRATGGPGTAQYLAAKDKASALARLLSKVGDTVLPVDAATGLATKATNSLIESALSRSGEEGAKILARLLQDPRYMAAMLEKARASQNWMTGAGQVGVGASGGASGAMQK